MTYTVTNLINDAYYVTGIVSLEFQGLQGSQVWTGLNLLNEILGDKVVEEDMIPYWTTGYQWNSIAGQEEYFIPGLISCETLTFFIDSVRYNTAEIPMDQYFGSARANDIDSLPFTWHQTKVLNGSNIWLYFFPNVPYVMEMTGYFQQPVVTLNMDLQLMYDRFYCAYLKYRLADKLATNYAFALPPKAEKELLRYEEMISKRSANWDLRTNIITTLSTDQQMTNYGQANLGRGWTVSN